MGVLLLKMAKIRHFFCAFLRATGVLVFLLSRCMWGGGVLLWLVVSFLCDVVGTGGFSGNRVSSCSWWWALGSLSVVVWGVTGVGTVGVMDRGYAIKFSYGRTVMSVAVRILSWWICGKHIIS